MTFVANCRDIFFSRPLPAVPFWISPIYVLFFPWPSSRSLECAAGLGFASWLVRANSWICCPQLPCQWLYRNGNSVKRSGPFSEPPDSKNWQVAVLIPFPKISSDLLDLESLTIAWISGTRTGNISVNCFSGILAVFPCCSTVTHSAPFSAVVRLFSMSGPFQAILGNSRQFQAIS